MFLQEMKWPEVDALDREKVIAVVCISALEQHSLHLPVSTDYLIGVEIVRRVEHDLPRTLLCLPPIWLGCSDHHMDFVGNDQHLRRNDEPIAAGHRRIRDEAWFPEAAHSQ